jgi:hypothetical protein
MAAAHCIKYRERRPPAAIRSAGWFGNFMRGLIVTPE